MDLDELAKETLDSRRLPSDSGDCKHYERGCKLVAPCCKKVYPCRFCHDENEFHDLIRSDVRELICASCDTRQPVRSSCRNCRLLFGRHICLKCNLYDYKDKQQFHCDSCGMCRVGGRDNFCHCEKCDNCMPRGVGHKCIERGSRSNCPVCLEYMHTSRMPCYIPACGHLIHRNCYQNLLSSGNYACPLCQVSLPDMSQIWRDLDKEIEETPMPEHYRNARIRVLCKDCHEKSRVKYHLVGLKCAKCGSYNTCKEGPVMGVEEDVAVAVVL